MRPTFDLPIPSSLLPLTSRVARIDQGSLDRYRIRYHIILMTKREKLLDAVRNNPRDVRFDDLVRLVKALGFVAERQTGSHIVFVHTNPKVPFVNLQEGKNGKAKPYQVEQVLALVDAHKLEV